MNNKKRWYIILGVVVGLILFSQILNEGSIIGKSVLDMWAIISVSINIKAVNITTIATTTATTTATEDAAYIYDVNASFVSGRILAWGVNSSQLFNINSNSGLISFTPINGQNGSYAVNISVSDNLGSKDSQAYTLVISAVNDAPILNTIGNLTGETGISSTYSVIASDEEGAILVYSIPSKDEGLSMSINSATGVIAIPSGNSAGAYSATIRVTDGNTNVDENIIVNIVTTNSPPTIESQANSISDNLIPTIREDQNITFNLTFNDNDGNNTANSKWHLKNGSLSFNEVSLTNQFTFIPEIGKSAGEYKIYAEVSDGLSAVNTSTWTLTVIRVLDTDRDEVYDYADNCKFISNSGQADSNSNGIGDACEDDFDGDGVDDNDDFIDGGVNSIETKDSSGGSIDLKLKIDDDEDVNQTISGDKEVKLTSTIIDSITGSSIEAPLVEFNHSFSEANNLDLSNVSIKSDIKFVDGSSKSVLVVSGISLISGNKKTVYLDVLLNQNGVCIRDIETSNINELSDDCSGSSEVSVGCDGASQSGYICVKNSTTNRYSISGLSFSGVGEEICTESWSCTSYSACSNSVQIRTCEDNNHCGTENDKPVETQSCSETGEGSVTAGVVSNRGATSGENRINVESVEVKEESKVDNEVTSVYSRISKKDSSIDRILVFITVFLIIIFLLIRIQRKQLKKIKKRHKKRK